VQQVDSRREGYVAVAAGTLTLSGAAVREFLAAVLERGVPFRFTARGYSMHPFIMDADVITVSPLGGRGARVGQVVAFRGGQERLVVHRIVAAGGAGPDLSEGYLIRGDNCAEADGFVPREAILGVVTRVERIGRPRRFGIGPEAVVLAGLSRADALRPAMICAHMPRRAAGAALRRVQRAPACRRLLRRLRPGLAVERALAADEAELARRFGLSTNLRPRPDDVEVRAFVARLLGGHGEAGRIIGYVELVRRASAGPFDGSWIHSTTVATQYRGMGVAEALVGQAIGAARGGGAEEVRLTVHADNAPALALYDKLGFVPGGSPALTELLDAEARRGGRRRVALRLTLNGAGAGPVEVDA
jgi:ribosomal protein S18 acetylase RimI-like enzyme